MWALLLIPLRLATLEVPGELRKHPGAGREKNAVRAGFNAPELATVRPERQVQAAQQQHLVGQAVLCDELQQRASVAEIGQQRRRQGPQR